MNNLYGIWGVRLVRYDDESIKVSNVNTARHYGPWAKLDRVIDGDCDGTYDEISTTSLLELLRHDSFKCNLSMTEPNVLNVFMPNTATPTIHPARCAYITNRGASARIIDLSTIDYDLFVVYYTDNEFDFTDADGTFSAMQNAMEKSYQSVVGHVHDIIGQAMTEHRTNGVIRPEYSMIHLSIKQQSLMESCEISLFSDAVDRLQNQIAEHNSDISSLQSQLRDMQIRKRTTEMNLEKALAAQSNVTSFNASRYEGSTPAYKQVIPMPDGIFALTTPLVASDDDTRGDPTSPIHIVPHMVHIRSSKACIDEGGTIAFHPTAVLRSTGKSHPHMIDGQVSRLTAMQFWFSHNSFPCIGGEMTNAIEECKEKQDVEHLLDLMLILLGHYTHSDGAGESYHAFLQQSHELTSYFDLIGETYEQL